MAQVDVFYKDGFSFIWTIQNLSYCVERQDEALSSPKFQMNEDDDGKWCLKLYLKGDFYSDTIALKLRNFSNRRYSKELRFELSICTSVGIFKQEVVQKELFSSNSEHLFHSIVRQKDLNKKRADIYPNNDSLTVVCRILEVDGKLMASRQCHVRTIIAVERTTCIWTIENFVSFNNNNRPIKQPPVLSQISSFTMEIFSTERTFADDQIQIEIMLKEPVNKVLFSTCKTCFLGVDGKIVHSVRDEHYFEKSNNEQIWTLSLIPMNKVLSRKELYLPNGTLSLRCEFAVSSGVSYNEVEITENGKADLNKLEYCKQEKESGFKDSLKDNLQCFYAEGKFSDLTIRSPNKEFRVHKTILCARSEVFSAMFERDMKENLTGVVDIEDVDDDTVSKMLLFVYTDTVGENLEFETASSLYFAADKYGIVALKRKCSDFFKGNFTVTNICDVLVLADRDQELKSDTQNFIYEHSGEIMESEEWKQLMQEKVSLASKTMHAVLRKS